MKFTFKKRKKKGRFSPDQADVKLRGKVVGLICENSKARHYEMMLSVKDSTDYYGWRWIKLMAVGIDEAACREFLNLRIEQILVTYELHSFDD
jgi:hypothetical protein